MEKTNWLEFSIVVHPKKGTVINFKVDPKVEEFFKGFVSGVLQIYPIYEGYGHGNWGDPDEEVSPFNVYPLPNDIVISNGYGLDKVGGELIDKKNGNRVNLSFLRIVGASSPNGASFKYGPARTKEYWQGAQAEIGRQFRNFCEDFIVPYSVSLKVVS